MGFPWAGKRRPHKMRRSAAILLKARRRAIEIGLRLRAVQTDHAVMHEVGNGQKHLDRLIHDLVPPKPPNKLDFAGLISKVPFVWDADYRHVGVPVPSH